MTGSVTLVGAGAGGLDLLTLGGYQALTQGDVVVYDRLVSPQILASIPSGIKTINVGKHKGHHPLPQEDINSLLIRLAQEGNAVVRLKGGDNYLFGRGGEEVLALQEQGIPVKVIAGLSSILAAPSGAGIPVTHRGVGSSLHVFTGHRKEGEPLSLDYPLLAALVAQQGTLLFLMAVSSCPQIITGLLQRGLPPKTPCAIIQEGARPSQRVYRCHAEEVSSLLEQEHITSPAMFLVGEVCALDLSSPVGSLYGRHFLLTQATDRESKLSSLLEQEGASVSIATLLHSQYLNTPLPSLSPYHTIMFTSPRGVDAFLTQVHEEGYDARALAGKILAVVGESTATALKQWGLRADFCPESPNGTGLAREYLQLHPPKGLILLVTGSPSSGAVQEVFTQEGQDYHPYLCYQTQFQESPLPQGNYDAVLCTSGAMVEAFHQYHPQYTALTAFCIGKETEAKAKNLGYATVTSPRPTLSQLVETVKEFYHDSSPTSPS